MLNRVLYVNKSTAGFGDWWIVDALRKSKSVYKGANPIFRQLPSEDRRAVLVKKKEII
jgi:hypothetical protein